jgi:hypothetical protein
MAKDFKDLSLPLNKVIELGQVDRWLRGIADIVPQPTDHAEQVMQERELHASLPGVTVAVLDSNAHILPFAETNLIEQSDITRMKGFQQLIQSASRSNVRVDIESVGGAALEVIFEPDEPFSRSQVFGATYANVIPAVIGAKSRLMK